MIGWAIPLLCAALLLLALTLLARPGRGALQLTVAFMLLGLAGYAWQGSPGLAGQPARAAADKAREDTLFARERKAFFETMGPDAQMLDMTDALIRNGNPAYAAGLLRGELSRRPRSATLWIAYGHALSEYAGGMVTPAARFAFERGRALAPRNPAASYFLGLALAQSGDLDGAEAVWSGLVPVMTTRPEWRVLLAQKLFVLGQIRSQDGG
ncbi:tetratricopeptide repeat protein [Sphingomonas sp.]|uniref:tetratricopeptide repeat protein n=1 Tax=Sphingomonas sp. TaxID=28214 RepID=UPI003B3A2433